MNQHLWQYEIPRKRILLSNLCSFIRLRFLQLAHIIPKTGKRKTYRLELMKQLLEKHLEGPTRAAEKPSGRYRSQSTNRPQKKKIQPDESVCNLLQKEGSKGKKSSRRNEVLLSAV